MNTNEYQWILIKYIFPSTTHNEWTLLQPCNNCSVTNDSSWLNPATCPGFVTRNTCLPKSELSWRAHWPSRRSRFSGGSKTEEPKWSARKLTLAHRYQTNMLNNRIILSWNGCIYNLCFQIIDNLSLKIIYSFVL